MGLDGGLGEGSGLVMGGVGDVGEGVQCAGLVRGMGGVCEGAWHEGLVMGRGDACEGEGRVDSGMGMGGGHGVPPSSCVGHGLGELWCGVEVDVPV